MQGLFVTGTNTGVGKTYVTCGIVRELLRRGVNVGAYKPVCSGSEPVEGPGARGQGADEGTGSGPLRRQTSRMGSPESVRRPTSLQRAGPLPATDADHLADALDRRFPTERICPQRFSAALAPPAAARREGRCVDRELLFAGLKWWEETVDVLLVEGVGGWLSPIADGTTVADFAAGIGFPVLIVAGVELGAVSHTLLTVESITRRGLPIAGIVANAHRNDVDLIVAEETLAGIAAQTPVPIIARIPVAEDAGLHPADAFHKVDWSEKCGPGLRWADGGDGV